MARWSSWLNLNPFNIKFIHFQQRLIKFVFYNIIVLMCRKVECVILLPKEIDILSKIQVFLHR